MTPSDRFLTGNLFFSRGFSWAWGFRFSVRINYNPDNPIYEFGLSRSFRFTPPGTQDWMKINAYLSYESFNRFESVNLTVKLLLLDRILGVVTY